MEARYRELCGQLSQFETLSQGTVLPQHQQAWVWTRKEAGKTVTVALSEKKASEMLEAIANHRKLKNIIKEMREITQKIILGSPEITQSPSKSKNPNPALS